MLIFDDFDSTIPGYHPKRADARRKHEQLTARDEAVGGNKNVNIKEPRW